MFWTYVLQNPQGKLYIGQTSDLDKRLAAHNQGNTGYTTNIGGPWNLVYKELYQTRSEAMKREKELKTGKGRDFIKRALQSF
ncbi:MAG: GIY-YIG nuclease family protein [Patescibacteria group bacterium]